RLVFFDETFGNTAMTRLDGWGPTDQRVVDVVPHGHGKTTTFVAAFRPITERLTRSPTLPEWSLTIQPREPGD
ncbi:MAG TPA: hypothetical protein VH092_08285, partial [Urbifossiella sp.]|nr:hypothetical protein [Urbifossiella sp.]